MSSDISSKYLSSSVVFTSYRCSQGTVTDESGRLIVEKLIKFGFNKVDKHIPQDDRKEISRLLESLCDRSDSTRPSLVITVGGTGLCPRDVTPEATETIVDRRCPGIANALLMHSLGITPFAALSRLTAGIRGSTMIVNFPGKKQACEECWACLEPLISHILHQINYDRTSIDAFHAAQLVTKQECISNEPQSNSQMLDNLIRMISVTDTKPDPKRDQDGLTCCKPVGTGEIPPPLKSKVQSSKSARLRESKYPLVGYYEALDILCENSNNLYQESTLFAFQGYTRAKRLIGETLAEAVNTTRQVPPNRVATMDGFVLNIPPDLPEEFGLEGGLVFIEADILPDMDAFIVRQMIEHCSNSFYCYSVNTGGQIPEKDCIVVPIEKTAYINENKVSIYEFRRGMYIREPGTDLSMDFRLAERTVIGPIELSLLSTMGVDEVKIIKKPKISILSTGDEITAPFQKSDLDDVVDANGPLLTSFFSSKGFEVQHRGIVKDDCDELFSEMSEALNKSDILIISGGASMGTKDYVKEIIEVDLGGTIHFGRVNMKPGKPVAFATCSHMDRRKFIFCLPGNPVSAFITSLVLIMPFLRQSIKISPTRVNLSEPAVLSTNPRKIFDIITAELVEIVDDEKGYYLDDRMEFIRAVLVCFDFSRSKYLVSVSIKQQSSRLVSLLGCDCLLVVPSHINGWKLEVGQIYPALKL